MKSRALSESWQRNQYRLIGSTIPLRPQADETEVPPPWALGYSWKRHFPRDVNPEFCPLVELRLLQSMTGPCRHARRRR
jgi:hypothetical protein